MTSAESGETRGSWHHISLFHVIRTILSLWEYIGIIFRNTEFFLV